MSSKSNNLKDFKHIFMSNIFMNTYRDTASRLLKAEEECNRLQQELTSARRRGASLDADFHSKERTVNQLRTKVAVLEQVSYLPCHLRTVCSRSNAHFITFLYDGFTGTKG
jgi:hypothetical protein